MENTADKEIRITQILNAPVALLWQVWTVPDHISKWWGPSGFTTTIHEMEFREEGSWKLTLHGPDGKNYPNRSVYRKIVPNEKIIFEHFNPHFFAKIFFKSSGANTQIEWSMVFDSAEQRDIIVRVHKADDGLHQNLEKLEQYLAFMRGETAIK